MLAGVLRVVDESHQVGDLRVRVLVSELNEFQRPQHNRHRRTYIVNERGGKVTPDPLQLLQFLIGILQLDYLLRLALGLQLSLLIEFLLLHIHSSLFENQRRLTREESQDVKRFYRGTLAVNRI